MTTPTPTRAEINRRNSKKSTGPRTAEGKERSRFNAVKHGGRARLPVLPGEDPEAYQHRLDAWVGKFQPGDEVELYLVERAVHVSWQLDRADRAEAARLGKTAAAGVARRARDVAELGAQLFGVAGGTLWCYPDQVGAADRAPVSWPFDPGDFRHPAHKVAALESTAMGCSLLLERWSELRKLLDDGLNWQAPDRLRAIRLLGKQPLDVVDDERVMTIYLACRAMDPEGPDAFAEPLGELSRPEAEIYRARLAGRCAAARAERAPRDAAEGRAALRAIIAAAVARVEALRDVREAAEAASTATAATAPDFDASESGEWLRRHQATCSRTLFRAFDALRKVRKDFGGEVSGDEEPAASVLPPEEAPDSSRSAEVARAPSPYETAHGQDARATEEAEVARASSPRELVESNTLPPTFPEPDAVDPANDRNARNVTNEAISPATSHPSAPVGRESHAPASGATAGLPPASSDYGPPTADRSPGSASSPAPCPTEDFPSREADGPSASHPADDRPEQDRARDATNEANGPAAGSARPVRAMPVTAVTLLALLFSAGLASASGGSAEVVGPNPAPPRHFADRPEAGGQWRGKKGDPGGMTASSAGRPEGPRAGQPGATHSEPECSHPPRAPKEWYAEMSW